MPFIFFCIKYFKKAVDSQLSLQSLKDDVKSSHPVQKELNRKDTMNSGKKDIVKAFKKNGVLGLSII